MNTMITNPSKKVVVNANIEHVKKALSKMKDFCADGSNTIVITSGTYNDVMNVFNFMSKGQITGIIDLGMIGSATLVAVDEAHTEITVEIGKAMGSIDDQFEAQDCNNQVTQFITALGKLIAFTDEQLDAIEVNDKPQTSISGSAIGIAVAIIIALGIFLVL